MQQYDKFTFRGEHALRREWVYGGIMMLKSDTWIVQFVEIGGGYVKQNIPIKPNTVGQCTGLVDKNGTAIFEGDVLRFYDDRDPYCAIVWDESRLAFCTFEIERKLTCEIIPNRDDQYVNAYHDDCCLTGSEIKEDLVVAGNIYDNPELMEVAA